MRCIVLEHLGEDVTVREELAALADQDEPLHGEHRLPDLGREWQRTA